MVDHFATGDCDMLIGDDVELHRQAAAGIAPQVHAELLGMSPSLPWAKALADEVAALASAARDQAKR